MPNGQISNCDGSDSRANQLRYRAVDGLNHPAHLTVAAFGDGDLEKGLVLAVP